MFFLRSNEFWFSVSSLVLMRGGRVWSPVRCGVRGFSKIHHVGILPLIMPPNDFSSQLSSHLSSQQWAKLFSLFPFFPPPDDVRGLTRVQSPLTSSLSLGPDTPEMIETKPPGTHWSAWTSSSPSAFQVREVHWAGHVLHFTLTMAGRFDHVILSILMLKVSKCYVNHLLVCCVYIQTRAWLLCVGHLWFWLLIRGKCEAV